MDLAGMKKALLGDLPPECRRLVIAYAMQATILTQLEAAALKAGATRTKLEMVRGALPMLLGFLEGDAPV